jgi:hypothetical protein
MRKRKLLLVLATGAAFALSAGVGTVALSAGAATGTTTYPTTIESLGGAGFQTDWILDGRLNTNSKCRALRKVTLYKQTSSGYTQEDKILSSARGAWAFRLDADPTGPTHLKFTVSRDIRRNGNVVCEADTKFRTLGASTRAGTAASSADVARGTTAYPTHIHWRAQGIGPPADVVGQLDTNARCLGLRKVRMYKLTSAGYRRVDTILSSSRGAWGFLYESNYPAADRVRFTVTEAIRNNGNVTCRGSTEDVTFDY